MDTENMVVEIGPGNFSPENIYAMWRMLEALTGVKFPPPTLLSVPEWAPQYKNKKAADEALNRILHPLQKPPNSG